MLELRRQNLAVPTTIGFVNGVRACLGRKLDIPGELLRRGPTRDHEECGLMAVRHLVLPCLPSTLSEARAMTAPPDVLGGGHQV